jgi:hypothetical protein
MCTRPKFRERFRKKDFEFKLLMKLYMLRPTGTQQEYTTRFMYLLSQLPPLPVFIKRWLYQQNLRSETSAFVSENVPQNLSEVIELAQRFEDSQGQAPGKGKNKGKNGASEGEKKRDKPEVKTNGERWCAFCIVLTHNTVDRRKRRPPRLLPQAVSARCQQKWLSSVGRPPTGPEDTTCACSTHVTGQPKSFYRTRPMRS